MARRRVTSRPGPYLIHLELLRDRIPDPNRFPYTVPALQRLERLEFHPQVTFLIGENGSGKSTLLEAIAVCCGLNPEGGSRNFQFSTRPSHSSLDECLRLARHPGSPGDSFFLRAESFFNLATEIEKLDQAPGLGGPIVAAYGGQSLHEQSHGESFFSLFQHRFRKHGLYLLDEPEAALSPRRQMQFLRRLHELCQEGCQFVIATHAPIILAYPDARIVHLSDAGLTPTPYQETEHFLLTRGFLAHPQRTLDILLGSESDPAEGNAAED